MSGKNILTAISAPSLADIFGSWDVQEDRVLKLLRGRRPGAALGAREIVFARSNSVRDSLGNFLVRKGYHLRAERGFGSKSTRRPGTERCWSGWASSGRQLLWGQAAGSGNRLLPVHWRSVCSSSWRCDRREGEDTLSCRPPRSSWKGSTARRVDEDPEIFHGRLLIWRRLSARPGRGQTGRRTGTRSSCAGGRFRSWRRSPAWRGRGVRVLFLLFNWSPQASCGAGRPAQVRRADDNPGESAPPPRALQQRHAPTWCVCGKMSSARRAQPPAASSQDPKVAGESAGSQRHRRCAAPGARRTRVVERGRRCGGSRRMARSSSVQEGRPVLLRVRHTQRTLRSRRAALSARSDRLRDRERHDLGQRRASEA